MYFRLKQHCLTPTSLHACAEKTCCFLQVQSSAPRVELAATHRGVDAVEMYGSGQQEGLGLDSNCLHFNLRSTRTLVHDFTLNEPLDSCNMLQCATALGAFVLQNEGSHEILEESTNHSTVFTACWWPGEH